jgi:hypothetical protein
VVIPKLDGHKLTHNNDASASYSLMMASARNMALGDIEPFVLE